MIKTENKDARKRAIAIIGSTGSIGTQALEVMEANDKYFQLEVLTAGSNADLLIEQSIKHRPHTVVIANEDLFDKVNEALMPHDIKVFAGADAIAQVICMERIDMVLTAVVGFAGLIPTIAAIKAGKNIALANKETMVVAGELIAQLALEHNVNIFPVDSEHSAIFQCLVGENYNPIEKIVLTASGGPFRGKTKADLEKVTKADALKHPNWEMGAKITIDSASLMNKGLEVIEAKWLFHLKPEQIEVIVHPQSIIHSLVQFEDGSMKAQMGLPDMKLPIQYALGFPFRLPSNFPRFNFLDFPQLTFEKADMEAFPCLGLAFKAMDKGGNMPCVLNAANEVAVALFLKEEIRFIDIPTIIKNTMEVAHFIEKPSLEELVQTDELSRVLAANLAKGKE